MGGNLEDGKKKKNKIMEIASNYDSDLGLLLETFNKWSVSGKVTNNECNSCKKKLNQKLIIKDFGCRSCRVSFANANHLNNKILENVQHTKNQALKIITKLIPMQEIPISH